MICELKNRSVVKLTGNDAATFLQSLVTNDIKKASSEALLYAMLLSPQGRFLHDFFVLAVEGGFVLDCPKYSVQELVAKLNMYKLRQEIKLEILEDTKVYASDENIGGFIDPRDKKMGYRLITSSEVKTNADYDDYEKLRISNRIPDAEMDFTQNKSFPLEFGANELNAIDYKKGCYVGQEVTARTNYRGVVRKRLYHFCADKFISKDTEISAGDGKVGVVCGMRKNEGLCLLNIEDYERNVGMKAKFFAGEIEVSIVHD